MNIFDDVNSLPEELIARRLGLSTARDGKSFICPTCGNGSGKTGDGIKQSRLKGKLVWHCYRCDGHWSNADLVGVVEGIREQAELAQKLEELFPEYKPFFLSRENLATKSQSTTKPFLFSRDDSHFSAAERQASKSASRENFGYRSEGESRASSDSRSKTLWTVSSPRVEFAPPASEPVRASEPVPPRNYGKTFYPRYVETMRKFMVGRGGSYRGLTAETFEKYGVVVHPEFGVEGQEKLPTLIIPYDEEHFVARAIDSSRRPTQHGQGAGLYEPVPISLEYPNFIVEGELDALSVVQVVGSLGISCIATGGASKYRKVVSELEKRFGNVENKPSFLVMFDNDTAGKTNGLKLVNELRMAGYPAELYFLENQMAGMYQEVETGAKHEVKKVDANDLLQENPDELVRRLIEGIELKENKLREQFEVMNKSRMLMAEQKRMSAENKSGMVIYSFTEYFEGKFFRDIELTAKYSLRKTGFENIDEAQIFMPGLYMLGALPASGKTTFAWQLLNQLAEKGEPCIYCSFEMSRAELFTKSVVRELYKKNPQMSERLNLTSANIRRGAMRGSRELQEQAAYDYFEPCKEEETIGSRRYEH